MSNATDLQTGSANALPRPERWGAENTGARIAPNDRLHPVPPQYRSFAAGDGTLRPGRAERGCFHRDRRMGLAQPHPGRRTPANPGLPAAGRHMRPHAARGRQGSSYGGSVDRRDGFSRAARAIPSPGSRSMPATRVKSSTGCRKSISLAHDSLVDIGRRTAIEAVANLLFRLDRRIRGTSGAAPGTTVDFPPTQEQLGDALGLSAAHVCRTLRILRERGILSLRRHRLRIHDPAALRGMLVTGEDRPGNDRAA